MLIAACSMSCAAPSTTPPMTSTTPNYSSGGTGRTEIINSNLQNRINHVFVVMLENRSFDHMLGFSNIEGIDAVSGHLRAIEGLNSSNNWNLDSHGNKIFASSPADWTMPYDPGHEFDDVREQLCGAGG